MAKDGVVLLHGIFRTHRSMASFARFLERSGFAVLNLGYPSTKYSIEALADNIHPQISAFAARVTKLHFVGYSMGGLLIRAYLNKHRPEKLGRVVMIGTPNQGSEVADFLQNWRLYQKLYGPAGQQLITKQDSFSHYFGQVDYELGVIAGDRPIDIISSRIIRKPNDGTVSIDSTKITGMKDHVVVSSSHTFFPTHKQAWHQTLCFLQRGQFQ
jgi:triacylglycerol esterase/lipase EstA (alpha/beta hydrolase family)